MFFETEIYHNSLIEWLTAIAITFVIFSALYFGKKLTANKFQHAQRFIGPLQNTKNLVLLAVAIYAGSHIVTLPERVSEFIYMAASIALFVQIGFWVSDYLSGWSQRYRAKKIATNPGAVTTIATMTLLWKGMIWILVLLLILDNLGFDVTTLVAGLGIGGIAVALAAQNILGDLFASLSIVIDRPFIVNDFLIIDDYMGSVQKIGIKNTRLRSLSGEEIIISNSDLLSSRVRNYGRMEERRLEVNLNISFQTKHETLKQVVAIIREAVEAQEETRFDRAHFKGYASSHLEYQYVYFVLSPDFNLYMDVQEKINLHIHQRFEELGIHFAFPAQTLFIDKIDLPKSGLNAFEKEKRD